MAGDGRRLPLESLEAGMGKNTSKNAGKKKVRTTHLPAGAGDLLRRFPDIWDAYAQLGELCSEAGPLDARTRHLVKIALAAGVGSEGALHSHVRRGLAEGLDPDQIRHVALLAIPTLGLPGAVRTMTWIDDVLGAKPKKAARKR